MARSISSAARGLTRRASSASLLDAEKGGYFRIAPAAGSYVTKQLYFPSTAMLIILGS